MIVENVKLLLNKLNRYCLSQLDAAAGFAMSRGNYEITVEHILAKCLDDGKGDLPVLFAKTEVGVTEARGALAVALDGYRAGSTGRPAFSPRLLELLEQAWTIASIEFSQDKIRSGHLLMALYTPAGRQIYRDLADAWPGLGREKLSKVFAQGLEGSVEETPASSKAEAGKAAGEKRVSADGMEALAQFTENITEKARKGKVDPVFARDTEIRQMIDILTRRRKNNPILVGEPGTGKTAILEGLALRVAQGDVPPAFKDADIISLDLGLLQAGASVKGEFENRLKNIIQAIKDYPKPVITFIDEAHTLIGAGGSAGQNDAANLLKPALARGELRTVAATTWTEYKKYFEKDPALARRFQLVKVAEPDDPGACAILRGLKASYQKHHGTRMTDEGVTAAVALSRRYITGRQLPDKAIDLLDTAAARVTLSRHATPAAIQDTNQAVAALSRERSALLADKAVADPVGEIGARLQRIDEELATLEAEKTRLTERWEREKDLVAAYLEAVEAVEKSIGESGAASPDLERARAAMEALKEFQAGNPMVFPEVNGEVVASVIADWTGIPVGRMLGDEAGKLLGMRDSIRRRIVGQDQAVAALCEMLQVSKAGLKDPAKPMGVFLLTGPSGVGKTETALALAEHLFGGERYVVTVNMSEFQEKHNVSRLIGSPPGYVGYGEGGMLTEAVRQKPYSVVLLDEVEKAHPDVMELFYQVFDKGVLSDGEGRVVNFANTVLILTTNLASDLIGQIAQSAPEGAVPMAEDVVEAIKPGLAAHFKPALLARMTVVPYFPLGRDTISRIVRLKLGGVEKRLAEQGAALEYGQDLVDWIGARCEVTENGARHVDHVINSQVLPMVSVELLATLGRKETLRGKKLAFAADGGKLRFGFIGMEESLPPLPAPEPAPAPVEGEAGLPA
jgi:type VI secretion system protein VasG